VLWATLEQYLRQGLVSDSKVLDIRQVDVSDFPCFLLPRKISFALIFVLTLVLLSFVVIMLLMMFVHIDPSLILK
jgi:import inner membrane translocase subunit TIM44